MAKISKILLNSLFISTSRAEQERFKVTTCNNEDSAVSFNIIQAQAMEYNHYTIMVKMEVAI